MTFAPRLDALPEPQRALWPQLAAVPHRYVLYGGTALALRLAHRPSVDFDFFAHDPVDHGELDSALAFLRDATTLQSSANTRTVLVPIAGGEVKVSWFGGIAFGRVGDPERSHDGVLRAGSLLDLGATKVKALVQRVEAKDYRDILALLDAGIGLEPILGAATTLFAPAFNSLVAQKALCYFEGGDLDLLDVTARQRLIAAAGRDLDIPRVPRVSPRLD